MDVDDHFNFDMVMNVPNYPHLKKEKEDDKKNENLKNDGKGPSGKLKLGRKGKKLILRKKKDLKRGGEKKRVKIDGEGNDSRVYECHHPLCEKVFYDRNSYRKHLITHGEKQVSIKCNSVCVSV
jgi:hypothetical protein